jgi:hypothetical protein
MSPYGARACGKQSLLATCTWRLPVLLCISILPGGLVCWMYMRESWHHYSLTTAVIQHQPVLRACSHADMLNS